MSVNSVSQPSFVITHDTKSGKIGHLNLARDGSPLPPLQTPLLFPVVCMMTATTARGGGLWKYILQANRDHGLLRRHNPSIPLMTQVLHFLDFGLSPRAFQDWRKQGLRERYNETHSELDYCAPLFLDSGGFKLLFNTSLDLAAYDLAMDEYQAEQILELQRDLGGDLVATLDYPLPPGLVRQEAEERMRMSLSNATRAALHIQKLDNYTPFLFVAAHGQDGKDIEAYVSNVFKEMKHNGLADIPFGIAIGSLVPLRGSKKYPMIIELVRGAVRGIPKEHRGKTPVHVFGVTGNLIPLLVYLGVDTFDSSTYAQQARSLKYYEPDTHREHAVLEMERFNCDCRICRELDFDESHEALTSDIRFKPLPSGYYKSKYYADIALHNLEMDFRIVNRVRDAIEANDMVECLIAQAASSSDLRNALEFLAQSDEVLRWRMSRGIGMVPDRPSHLEEALGTYSTPTVSLQYTPDSFRLDNGYQPPGNKRILLVIPCSGGKPYSTSKSHQLISKRLTKRLGVQVNAVHKVTLSGLYGPVPEEFEEEKPVLRYDFRLDPANKGQVNLCTERMLEYLDRHGAHYEALFGYATSLAYRTVLENVSKECEGFQLYPAKPRTRRLSEFFRQSNIAELLEPIASVLGVSDEAIKEQ
jgi:7-cyano-7-deazaguanine tRNA-ribosyltransferase